MVSKARNEPKPSSTYPRGWRQVGAIETSVVRWKFESDIDSGVMDGATMGRWNRKGHQTIGFNDRTFQVMGRYLHAGAGIALQKTCVGLVLRIQEGDLL